MFIPADAEVWPTPPTFFSEGPRVFSKLGGNGPPHRLRLSLISFSVNFGTLQLCVVTAITVTPTSLEKMKFVWENSETAKKPIAPLKRLQRTSFNEDPIFEVDIDTSADARATRRNPASPSMVEESAAGLRLDASQLQQGISSEASQLSESVETWICSQSTSGRQSSAQFHSAEDIFWNGPVSTLAWRRIEHFVKVCCWRISNEQGLPISVSQTALDLLVKPRTAPIL